MTDQTSHTPYIPFKGEIGSTESFWPPRVVWARAQGWLNVRDPWGQWHTIEARQAPSGYVRLANQARRREG